MMFNGYHFSPFEWALHANMMHEMRIQKKQGTFAMGRRSFRMCVKPPSTTGGPATPYGYLAVFENVLAKADPAIKQLIYDDHR